MRVLVALGSGVHKAIEVIDSELAVADLVKCFVNTLEGGGEGLADLKDGVDLFIEGLELLVLIVVELGAEKKLNGFREGAHIILLPHVVNGDP